MATTIPSPDDIDELFREMELEPIAYRSFERRVPGRHSQPAELQRGGDVLTGAVAARLLEPETVSPLRDPRAIESIVQTVGSALDGAIAAPASRPASGVSLRVYSAGAGAGATTLLANLAYKLAGQGRTVVAADEEPDSVLPFHFGSRRSRSGFSNVLLSQGGATGEIYLLTRSESDDAARLDAASWMADVMRRWGVGSDYVLTRAGRPAVSARAEDDKGRPAADAAVSLLLVGMDAGSMYRIPSALERLDGRNVVLVLSKLDPRSGSTPACARGWRSDSVSGWPIALRLDETANVALSAGKPLLEYAPECPLSADFRALAAWLAGRPEVEARRRHW